MVAVQLFDTPFVKAERVLPRLQRLGVTHVLISPPQKSHASSCWWGRYQPVDFTRIEGPLGDAAQLHRLCQLARARGIAVVADTVLHHLSNEPSYVRMRGNRILKAQYPYFCERDLVGVHRLGRGRGLPVLDTHSPWVRSQMTRYLRDLFDLGVRGFRFDSAKHMDPELFPHLLQGLPPVLTFGELVYAHPQHFPQAYFRSMRAYDFPLAAAVRAALAPGGDLGALLAPQALASAVSVPFVNHHDLVKNRRGFVEFRVADLRDRRLAYAYILARGAGVPLLYGPDLRHPEVRGGLQFHHLCAGQPFEPVAATRTLLAFRRGGSALAAVNKAAQPGRLQATLQPGEYRDLISGWQGATDRGRLDWWLPGRSAALLVREGD